MVTIKHQGGKGGIMRRGTTPTLKIRVSGADLSEMENIYVTIKQGNKELTKSGTEVKADGDFLFVFLTQEDTLKFDRSPAWVQMRAVTVDRLAVASNIKMIMVDEILKDGVIV